MGGAGRKAAATAACALNAAAYATRLATDAGSGNCGVYGDRGSLFSDRLRTLSLSLFSKYRSRLSLVSERPSSSWMPNGERCGARGALELALIACIVLVCTEPNFTHACFEHSS